MKANPAVWIGVLDNGKGLDRISLQADLLAEFTPQGLLEGLPGPHLSAWELPPSGKHGPGRVPALEEDPVPAPDQGDHHLHNLHASPSVAASWASRSA